MRYPSNSNSAKVLTPLPDQVAGFFIAIENLMPDAGSQSQVTTETTWFYASDTGYNAFYLTFGPFA